MAVTSEDIDKQIKLTDAWLVRRIAIGGVLGFVCAAAIRVVFDGPVPASFPIFLSLLGLVLLLVGTVITLLAYLITALISLYRRLFRRMVSGIVAIVLFALCLLTVATAPIFDPWLWYVILNESRLEAEAATKAKAQLSTHPTIIEERDASCCIAVNTNHFIELIYSDTNLGGMETKNSFITHIYGNFYKRDEFD
jgi:hypothetical protein